MSAPYHWFDDQKTELVTGDGGGTFGAGSASMASVRFFSVRPYPDPEHFFPVLTALDVPGFERELCFDVAPFPVAAAGRFATDVGLGFYVPSTAPAQKITFVSVSISNVDGSANLTVQGSPDLVIQPGTPVNTATWAPENQIPLPSLGDPYGSGSDLTVDSGGPITAAGGVFSLTVMVQYELA